MLRKVCITLLFFVMCQFIPVASSPLSEVSYAASGVMVDDCIGEKKDNACKEETKTAVDEDKDSTAVGVSAWDYIKMIFALLFVVGLLYGVLRFINSRSTKYQQSKMMQNLGGISLGQQKSVQLVKVGNTLYLVGVGDDIHMLKEITDASEHEALLELYNEKQSQPLQGSPVAQLFNVFSKKKTTVNEEQPTNQFKNHFAERIEQIKKQRTDELGQLTRKERDKENE